MIINKIGYSYGDVTMIPSVISDISSRSECNPFIEGNKLPIFTAPMSTITNEKNIDIWKNNGIMPIIPRNIDWVYRYKKLFEGEWVALSLNEFKETFVNTKWKNDDLKYNPTFRVCVDLANGHMKSLYETINKAKEIATENNYTLIVMTGNIANPDTYEWICKYADVDYIRLNIGGGYNCLTASNTSTHYPIATLIDECHKFKNSIKLTDFSTRNTYGIKNKYYGDDNNTISEYKSCPKIVADGGIRGYADVIKALGIGADYVMIGSLFTGLLESAAPLIIECYNSHYKYSFNEDGTVNDGINDLFNIWETESKPTMQIVKRNFIKDMKSITKESYGMSTKKAQMLINHNGKLKTSEGCTKYIQVKETVHQWVDNMISYLKSAMSYSDNKDINTFIGGANFIVNSSCSILAVNK